MEEQKDKEKRFRRDFGKFHDKNHKLLLLIPLVLLILGGVYLGIFYSQNGDFIYRDISLKGGTSITIYDANIAPNEIQEKLSEQLGEVDVRKISDVRTREQQGVIIETTADTEISKEIIEEYLGYELIEGENSDFEFTSSSLGEGFYSQILLSILDAFIFMGAVVFLIFGKEKRWKLIISALAVFNFVLLMGGIFSYQIRLFVSLSTILFSSGIFFKKNMPSFAVIISAFADIFMTLILIDILGVKMSTAGIIAFLMLIGYSVDTDILLTSRVLKRDEGSLNKRMFGAFKTGITMSLTSLVAVVLALIVVSSFSKTLTQIFTVLSIGLSFDIFNTWITNASLIKWYVLKK